MTPEEPDQETTEQSEQQPVEAGGVEQSGLPIGVIIGGILLFFCMGLTLLIVMAISSRR